MIRFVSYVLLILATMPVLAQDAAPAGDEAIENIVITGQRLEGWSIKDYMLDFIGEIGDPVSDNNGFARWRDRVCVSVNNLRDAATAQYVIDRVSLVALEVGLTPGESGCKPNLNIIFTSDGRALANTLVTANRDAFRPYGGAGGTTQGGQALDEFVTSDAPVRWWQITMPVDHMGNVGISIGMGTPWIKAPGSRITNSLSDEVWTTYVIVDSSKIGNAGLDSLSDYLAMVSLAQVDPKGVPATYNSILNLFKTRNPATGLTELDRTYLHALYRMDTRRMPHMQRGLLASTMVLEQDRMAEKAANAE